MTDSIVRIFDTTLRDGEQSPGASMDIESKLRIAHQLDALGVDIIEAGFPITSTGDFEAVKLIAEEVRRPIIAGLARCIRDDVEAAAKAVAAAERPRIHVFCATSKIHRERKLGMSCEEIIAVTREHVAMARQFVEDVEFSPEDASRTELTYLVDIVGAAIEAGATTINIPDTVGYATPAEFGYIFKHLREQIPIIDQRGIILSAHCHDDLGLAVANSLAAVQNGARQVECTINGIGERAGNASMEEIVMAIRTRGDHYGVKTNVNSQQIYNASKLVSKVTGMFVQRNKAIVGENAFAHEAGIHQDGVLKHRDTYEIMDPQDVGLPTNKLVLGKHSGRHAFRERAQSLGYFVSNEVIDDAFRAFKDLADKKKVVHDRDIEVLIENQLDSRLTAHGWKLDEMQFTSATNGTPTATVTLHNGDGRKITDAAIGDGPVDAIFSAIQRIANIEVQLLDYQIQAVTAGKDAQGEVYLRICQGDQLASGRATSTDIVEASARAFLAAINRIKHNRESSSKEMSCEHRELVHQLVSQAYR